MFSPCFCGRFPVSPPPEATLVEVPQQPRGLGSGIHVAAQFGDVQALRHFLRVAPGRVDEKDPYGRWPQKTSVELRVCGVVVERCVEGARRNFQDSEVWC